MDKHAKYNLLSEKIFSVGLRDDQPTDLNLPDVLHKLGQGHISSFRALRPHQRHAWHAFLVQLAAMALHQAGESNPEQSSEHWRDLLLSMTDGDMSPWCLVVDDLSKPAFMQPPVPEGKIGKKWKQQFTTPGALDLLVTAKNHDVKAQLIKKARLEHWIFAIVSLQTMSGYLGVGNYGIARMNSGHASRPGIAMTTNSSVGKRFIRDTSILLAQRTQLINDTWPYKNKDGFMLIWLQPWDGASSLDLKDCDPYFIEICRRIRLQDNGKNLLANGVATKCARIHAEEIHGVTGDPWTPVMLGGEEPKALTITSAGFDYKLTEKLLFSGEYRHGMAWRQNSEKGDMFFIASALTRGKGKTEGLHQRVLKIPAKVSILSASDNGRSKLAMLSKRRIELCQEVRRKVLHRALCVITQGDPDAKIDFRDSSDNAWLQSFENDVDTIFFESMFSQIDLDKEEADKKWTEVLLELAEKQLNNALSSMPQPSIRRYRIDSAAHSMFHAMARKTFTFLFQKGDSQ